MAAYNRLQDTKKNRLSKLAWAFSIKAQRKQAAGHSYPFTPYSINKRKASGCL